ncbi:MutS-related protein [Clostridium sp. Marseille-P2415]|uniref:MutS-related protein n=1 Tax=Clostridium sp. Marseille-P2415 TaxID=1805471 RepID=UPI0009885505|nr:hypothetical protein [Clostridium sp. Marseille-P2415]
MQIIIILFLITFMILFLIIERNFKLKRIQNNKDEIAKSFGKKTENQSFERELIERFWEVESAKLSENDRIDDITWYDLEMDQVYCMINNCKSFAGDQILYSVLHKIENSGNDYVAFQRKIDYFESEVIDRNEIWYIISGMGKNRDSYYLSVFIKNFEAFRIPHIEYYHFMRIFLLLSFIPAIVFMNYIFLLFPFFVALTNIVIYAFQKNRYESYLNMLSSVLKILIAAKRIVDSPTLKYEKKFDDLGNKIAKFRRLFFKISKLQHRSPSNLSGDAMTLFESMTFGITLWDLIQYDKVICQLIGYQKELMALYTVIGEIDSAISVASFRNTLPFYCTPIFSKCNEIIAEDIFHPLVEKPIYNSIVIKKGCIITGSNASGKSTFIKGLAINALLAQSIHTCFAKKLVMPFSTIITSMAVRDEVTTGESYYIKEIKYIKRIIHALNEEKLVLCIIDEILRGTNTEERIAASVAILKYLYGKNCITVVATHDIELTEMMKKYYENFHFTEHINDKKILFEYKIHQGPAISRNAIKLLEYMEFPKEITEEAVKIFLSDNKIV